MQSAGRSYSLIFVIVIIANLISFAGFVTSSSTLKVTGTELVIRNTPDSKLREVSYTSYLLAKENYAPLFLTISYTQIENIISKRCSAAIKVQNLSINTSLVPAMLKRSLINGLRKDPVDDYRLV